jgi:phosphatidylglycerol:prolipoprotein diacylglycerol transferase
MTHDLSGFFPHLHFGSGLDLPTYFLVVSLALCVAVFWLAKRAEKQRLSRNTALDLSLVVMIAGFVGSRLVHVFFEAPSYYAADPTRVFEIWRGGFVWYGGAIAGAAAGLAYLRHRALNIWRWLDLTAPVIAFGYAMGRIACVLTGCCFGAVCTLIPNLQFRYPTQVFAVIWELTVLASLLLFERRRHEHKIAKRWTQPGQIFFVWLLLHGVGRIIMELFRADDRGPAIAGLSLASWVSLVLVAFAFKSLRRPA